MHGLRVERRLTDTGWFGVTTIPGPIKSGLLSTGFEAGSTVQVSRPSTFNASMEGLNLNRAELVVPAGCVSSHARARGKRLVLSSPDVAQVNLSSSGCR